MLQKTSMNKFQYILAQMCKNIKKFKVLINMPNAPKRNFTKKEIIPWFTSIIS